VGAAKTLRIEKENFGTKGKANEKMSANQMRKGLAILLAVFVCLVGHIPTWALRASDLEPAKASTWDDLKAAVIAAKNNKKQGPQEILLADDIEMKDTITIPDELDLAIAFHAGPSDDQHTLIRGFDTLSDQQPGNENKPLFEVEEGGHLSFFGTGFVVGENGAPWSSALGETLSYDATTTCGPLVRV
jgi:hypothetical protein